MSFQLREGLSYCRCGDRIILLDLESDRYFGLGHALERAFINWTDHPDAEDCLSDLRPLLDQGLLIRANSDARSRSALAAGAITRDVVACASIRQRDVVEALATEFFVRFWLRSRPLASVVERLKRAARQTRKGDADTGRSVGMIAAAFERSALLMGSSDRCLSRALAAMIICRRREIDATLVFGVRINPFGAHCWVQHRSMVLVGGYEQARLFTPILAVP